MAIYKFKELVDYARANSKFYSEYYKDIPDNESNISKYPIMAQEKYWAANTIDDNTLLTGKFDAGLVFKSGGTTGNPKFSYFTNEEWQEFVKISGFGYKHNGIKQGDKVANLFYAGELYASFIYITFSSYFANVGVNYPISGATEVSEIVNIIKTLNINVLAGTPTTIIKVAEYIYTNKVDNVNIDLVLFGGESFYTDQRESLNKIFPNVKINSIMYASVDGGELGYFDATCKQDEHRCLDDTTILEIVDEENGQVIEDEEIGGKILITNLTRKLMPIIRYPAGDRAKWVEPKGTPNRKFKILGRTEEGARIGPCTLYIEDVLKVLDKHSDLVQVINFQIVLDHFDNLDKGTLLIVPISNIDNNENLLELIKNSIYEERHMLTDLVEQNLIHPFEVRFINNSELITNKRTGKAKRVVDLRLA